VARSSAEILLSVASTASLHDSIPFHDEQVMQLLPGAQGGTAARCWEYTDTHSPSCCRSLLHPPLPPCVYVPHVVCGRPRSHPLQPPLLRLPSPHPPPLSARLAPDAAPRRTGRARRRSRTRRPSRRSRARRRTRPWRCGALAPRPCSHRNHRILTWHPPGRCSARSTRGGKRRARPRTAAWVCSRCGALIQRPGSGVSPLILIQHPPGPVPGGGGPRLPAAGRAPGRAPRARRAPGGARSVRGQRSGARGPPRRMDAPHP
jgi:hypothetical protein